MREIRQAVVCLHGLCKQSAGANLAVLRAAKDV